MTAGDVKVVLAVLLTAALASGSIFFWKNRVPQLNPVELTIEVDGQEKQRFFFSDLEAGGQHRIKGVLGYSLLEVGDNKIRMVESPCPDKICIGMGWISQPGESIVCIPNRVVVRIVGSNDNGYDALSR